MSKFRTGWRFFVCSADEDDRMDGLKGVCGHAWHWPSRDCLSPSSEDCPVCGTSTPPHDHLLDPTIPHNEWGNLKVPYNWNPPTENDAS